MSLWAWGGCIILSATLLLSGQSLGWSGESRGGESFSHTLLSSFHTEKKLGVLTLSELDN